MKQKNKMEDVVEHFRCQFVRKFVAGKGNVRANSGNKKGKGIVRAVTGKDWDF